MSSSPSDDQNSFTPPPSGDALQAENYIRRLINLINKDIVEISETDLAQFEPGPLLTHFRVILNDYHVELSHNKHPQTGVESHIMLFTNIKNTQEKPEKIILAYMHLHATQFEDLKSAAHSQKERIRKKKEEKRLKDALRPIDQMLDEISVVEITVPAIS